MRLPSRSAPARVLTNLTRPANADFSPFSGLTGGAKSPAISYSSAMGELTPLQILQIYISLDFGSCAPIYLRAGPFHPIQGQ